MQLNRRESNLELLKIIAMFGIVLCHIYSTFSVALDNDGVAFFDKFSFSVIQYFIFQIFITLGYFSNLIFLVCSSFFLLEDMTLKLKKVFILWTKTFLVSVIFLLIYYLLGIKLENEVIINSFLPISKENNWYITAYLVLYIIHPFINMIINNINKKQHFAISLILFIVYFVFDFLFVEKAFYKNDLIVFISVYFIVAYLKKHTFSNNTKIYKFLLFGTSIIFYGCIFINFAIFPINIKWHVLNNPILLIMSISLVFICANAKLNNNKLINRISSYSLLVYLIHDNIIFKEITRPKIISKIMNTFGVNNIVVIVLITSLVFYVFSIICSASFDLFFSKFVTRLSIKLEKLLNKYCKM